MLRQIKALVEIETKIKDISVKSRKRDIVNARVMYYYLSRKYTSASYERIAGYLNRNHATAIHSLKNYDSWKFAMFEYSKELEKLHSIERLIPEIAIQEVEPVDFHELFRARNIALNEEISQLRSIVKEKDAEIKRLSTWKN